MRLTHCFLRDEFMSSLKIEPIPFRSLLPGDSFLSDRSSGLFIVSVEHSEISRHVYEYVYVPRHIIVKEVITKITYIYNHCDMFINSYAGDNLCHSVIIRDGTLLNARHV